MKLLCYGEAAAFAAIDLLTAIEIAHVVLKNAQGGGENNIFFKKKLRITLFLLQERKYRIVLQR